MALSYEEYLAKHPVTSAERTEIDAHKQRMLAEVRAYRLRELREQAGLTQAQLAERIGVSQRQVSKIENGDLENAKISTIRATSRPSAEGWPSSTSWETSAFRSLKTNPRRSTDRY